MDEQVKAILLTFAFDMCIFLLELSIFFCIRSTRGDEDKAERGLFNYHPVNFHLKQVFNTADLKPSIANEEQDMNQFNTNAAPAADESKAADPVFDKALLLDGFQNYTLAGSAGRRTLLVGREENKRRQLKDPLLVDKDGEEEQARQASKSGHAKKQAPQPLIRLAPTADDAGPRSGRNRPMSTSHDTRELAQLRQSASQVAALQAEDGASPLLLKVDVADRRQRTFFAHGEASQVFTIDDVELEFPANAPVEAENRVEQDGFKNPYFRKRANSLVLKHQSKIDHLLAS